MNNSFNDTVTAYIGLGSNLADPVQQVRSARLDCAAIPGVWEIAFSSLYRSPPMGPQDQPDYVNAVMAVSTDLTAPTLLRHLQRIEQAHGRVRSERRWIARTLDLDLLIYGGHRIKTSELTVPHPGLSQRAFVVYPLAEIAPELVVPGLGRVADLVVNCPRDGLERIE
jgi:2-amino-4-hydroxy-6-hydroxymethyldihydropteridine diphosphokinase